MKVTAITTGIDLTYTEYPILARSVEKGVLAIFLSEHSMLVLDSGTSCYHQAGRVYDTVCLGNKDAWTLLSPGEMVTATFTQTHSQYHAR